jgi:hypothetical protein
VQNATSHIRLMCKRKSSVTRRVEEGASPPALLFGLVVIRASDSPTSPWVGPVEKEATTVEVEDHGGGGVGGGEAVASADKAVPFGGFFVMVEGAPSIRGK